MAASPQDPLPAPTRGTDPPPPPTRRALPRGWENLGESVREYSATLICSSPHTRVHSAPPHTRVHHSASVTARPAPQPPAAIRLSVCPPPAPTEQPSLPPPPERFRSVSIDKSGALPRRRCNGAQRVRGCRGAQAHGGVGVRGGRLDPHVGLYTCDFPGVRLHTCGVSQVCSCTRVCKVLVQIVHVCLGVHTCKN